MAIGIFDSGVGGLTVLKEVKKILPNEKIYYFGDTGRVPYGEKSNETIVEYCREITDFLVKKKVETVVIACNTATVMALDTLQREYKNINVIGVIDPGIKAALYTTKENKIGVIGTNATINSGKYEKEIKKYGDIEVYSKGCPLLVYGVEDGTLEGRLIQEIIKMYLDDIVGKIDTLVLGCTHFPLLEKELSNLYPNINFVNPALETAMDLKEIVMKSRNKSEKIENVEKNVENILEKTEKDIETEYFVTGDGKKFKEIGTKFLGENINSVEIVKF